DLPVVLGTDGQKMSKSRGNTIMLKMTADETARVIKGAKTDAERHITYEPQRRPEVANLLRLVATCTGELPEAIAARIGEGGGRRLKAVLTEALNAKLAPIRERRARYAADPGYVREVARRGRGHPRAGAQGDGDGPRVGLGTARPPRREPEDPLLGRRRQSTSLVVSGADVSRSRTGEPACVEVQAGGSLAGNESSSVSSRAS